MFVSVGAVAHDVHIQCHQATFSSECYVFLVMEQTDS